MKKIILCSLFIASVFPCVSYGGGIATRICIENKSATTYYISGTDVDSFDWEDLHDDGAMNRPDHNWVNYKLDPGEVKCQPEDINTLRSAKFFAFNLDTQTTKNVAKTWMRISCTVDNAENEEHNCHKWTVMNEGSSPRTAAGRLVGNIHDWRGNERSECIHTKQINGYEHVCSLFYINK